MKTVISMWVLVVGAIVLVSGALLWLGGFITRLLIGGEYAVVAVVLGFFLCILGYMGLIFFMDEENE